MVRRVGGVTPLVGVRGGNLSVLVHSFIDLMIFGCWNIRGLNDPMKQAEVRRFFHEEKLSLCGLVETKVRDGNLLSVSRAIHHSWKVYCHSGVSPFGRIWVCWNPLDIDVAIIRTSSQAIHCRVSDVSSRWSCVVTVVYGECDYERRRDLWADLVASSYEFGDSPWLVMGDFNAIRSPSEHSGGSLAWASWKEDLGCCLDSAGLTDVQFSGCRFTWNNKQVASPIWRKLDRAVANTSWECIFPGSSARFLPPSISDHSPMIVTLVELPKRKIPFKFFDYWAAHPDFLQVVASAWEIDVTGTPMFRLCQKLKSVKVALKKFSVEHFSNLSGRVVGVRRELERVQCALQENPCDSVLLSEEASLSLLFGNLLRAEEGLVRQKSRIQWLNLGDQNTKFFFQAMKQHHSRSKITSISKEDGTRLEDPALVKEEIVTFYNTLLGPQPRLQDIDRDLLQSAITQSVSDEQREVLVREVSDEEIRAVMFSLKDNKAPGPDGFNSGFFKKAWSVVGDDVLFAIKSFFSSGKLLKQVNATTIALIPKVSNPSQVKDFRPISCCNTIYKCIAKLIADRVKIVLPSVISPNQSAFVAGWRISDNILLCHELVRNYHRNGGVPRCALKVDLMKAYDTVRWDFMIEVLRMIGFPEKMVVWIRECMTTTMFSVSINGELNGFFPGGRGLRQGDPLSPYLFVLAMEVLSGLLHKMALERNFKFHWRCSKNHLTHLCFADDLMILCKGEEASVSMIRDCLQQFMGLSGLVPNPAKSHMFSCGISMACKLRLLSILGFQEGVLPMRYLGVPLISTKLRASDCTALVERIIGRAKSWSCRTLSYTGRLQLVKSVLFSIQVYWSSLFILPKSVIKKVETTLRSFLWKGSDLIPTGARVAWDRVCLPKEEGGLGIKTLEHWNKAAIVKHLWLLCSGEDSSWATWVRSYLLRGRSFWEVACPGDCSWSWRKILSLRSWVRRRMRFRIGNGETALLWFDNWHPMGPIVDIMGERVIYDSGLERMARVAAIVDGSSWRWPPAQSTDLLQLARSLPLDCVL